MDNLKIIAPNWEKSALSIELEHCRIGARIVAEPYPGEDRQVMAFVQALLSEGLAQSIPDHGIRRIEICVKRPRWPPVPERSARLSKALAAPLLPFARRRLKFDPLVRYCGVISFDI